MRTTTSRAAKEELYHLLQEKRNRQSILNWLEGKVNENGVPITLKGHEFQRAIWEDFSPVMTIMKASQIGISTVFILRSVYMLKRYAYNIIYTLPTLMNDVAKFVPSKFDPIITKNNIKMDRSTTTQKQIGNGFLFLGGTFSEKEGIMSTADVLIHDELDRSNLDVVDTYKSRLGHSLYRRRWYFSNPSVPSDSPDRPNVNYWWNRSDQKHWFVKCDCGQGNYGGWQFMSWPESFDMDNRRFICQHCGREITADMISAGQWVAKYPDRPVSGYWISRMCAPWMTAGDIISEFEEAMTMSYFYNFVLGLPYLGADVQIGREIIMQNLTESTPDMDITVMGIDVGVTNHVVIGNSKGIIRVADCSWDDLPAFMTLYDPRMVVIDAMPEITKAKEFQKRYKGRVLRCYYRAEQAKSKPAQVDTYEVDWDKGTMSAWRTEAIDLLIEELANHQVLYYVGSHIGPDVPIFAGGKPAKKGSSYVEQWESLYLVRDEDYDPPVRSWEHSGPDHFAHATVYWWLAKQVAGPKQKHKVRVQ
jgi:hypothetical protein